MNAVLEEKPIEKTEKAVNIATGAKPKFAVIRFPGSNCDQDAYHVASNVLGCPTDYVWHQETKLNGYDIILLPGGFSYGDYLRTGAVARFAPIMDAVRAHAERGGLLVGICNGFQILCEAHLLPGALVRNSDCKFVCRYVNLRVENAETPFTSFYQPGQVLQIPVAHGEGRYVCDDVTQEKLIAQNRVLFRYCNASGEPTPRRQPERFAGQHRWNRQRKIQRLRTDAAPGTRLRKNSRFRRRARRLRVAHSRRYGKLNHRRSRGTQGNTEKIRARTHPQITQKNIKILSEISCGVRCKFRANPFCQITTE